MSNEARSSKDSESPASVEDAASTTITLPPPSATVPDSLVPSLASRASEAPSVPGAPKKKKSTKKKTKSTAPPAIGESFELTPSSAVPPVVAKKKKKKSKAPPANDVGAAVVAPEDLDDHDFFRASSAPVSMSRVPVEPMHELHEETRDPRIEALMTAEVKRRRAHFAKYVKAAVAISLVLCIAAVVRVGIRRNHSDDSTSAMAATTERTIPVAVVPEPPTAQKPIDPPPPPPAADIAAEPTMTADPVAPPEPTTTASAEPAPAPSAVASAAAPEPAPPASAAAVATADPSAPAELDPKAALKEKRKSQQLLDQGKIVDAIEHGEMSVKLDPTDAEAWLILGAAYQMKGDQKEAKRCFGSCIKEGKRGPKGECMAMPH